MKIKNITLALSLPTMMSASGWSAEIGIDRFERNGWYLIANKQRRDESETKIFLDSNGSDNHTYTTAGPLGNYYCQWRFEKTDGSRITGHLPASLTDDIRRSQIDQELFDTHLDEGNYGAAWKMSALNEQGNLWKRRAIARAKTDIVKYIEQGVFRHKDQLLQRSTDIVDGFQSVEPNPELTAVYQELNTFYQTTHDTAIQERELYLQRPEVAHLSDVLRSELVDRLLGEES